MPAIISAFKISGDILNILKVIIEAAVEVINTNMQNNIEDEGSYVIINSEDLKDLKKNNKSM